MTTVIDLRTGKNIFYSCQPDIAVIAAYEQDRKNWNTWNYSKPEKHPQFSQTNLFFFCGDFGASKEKE